MQAERTIFSLVKFETFVATYVEGEARLNSFLSTRQGKSGGRSITSFRSK